jgi:hypothetical protein
MHVVASHGLMAYQEKGVRMNVPSLREEFK